MLLRFRVTSRDSMLANCVDGGSGTGAGQAVCVNPKCVRATYTGLESFGSVENRKYITRLKECHPHCVY